MSETCLISTIQRYSTKDGPGIRSTVFMLGCNLRCAWCANPELIVSNVQYMHFENRCTHCGACVKIAANQSIQFAAVGCTIDWGKCTNMEACMDACPQDAYEKVGYETSAADLSKALLKDEIYYKKSSGGVTFSGGEPALHGPFIIQVAKQLHQKGVHVALDTAGRMSWERLKPIVEAVDLVLYDIKAYDGALHARCTGQGNTDILDNARKIAALGKEIIIRLVIVPGWNDQWEDIEKRLLFVKELGSAVIRVDVLRYHTLGVGKYQRLGWKYSIEQETIWDEGLVEEICKLAVEYNLNVHYDRE